VDTSDVNAGDDAGYTPLMNAAQRGNAEMVRLLLSRGANVNAVSAQGDISGHFNSVVKNGPLVLGHFTPLVLQAATSSPEVTSLLVEGGADVNAKDIRGMTPLMLAVATDHPDRETIRLLLARGVDVNAGSLDGETALDWTRKQGAPAIVDMLIRAGATASPRGPSGREAEPARAAAIELRPAVARSLALLEKVSGDFEDRGGCASCHAQNVTDVAAAAARAHGFAVNQNLAAARLKVTRGRYASNALVLLERADVGGDPDVPLSALLALAESNVAPDWATDVAAIHIAAQQLRDGRWHLGGIARPPMSDGGDMMRTAEAIHVLRTFAPPARGDVHIGIEKAIDWLRAASPVTLQERNFQLLGLTWGGDDPHALASLTGPILSQQRQDGGWAQRDGLRSDAYATGQTMYALMRGGDVPASAGAIRRCVKYLLMTVRPDGSWYVRSRAPKFQPYFESGFPYGPDQWISQMATGWATAALAQATTSGPRTQ
jgi:ankyrin repeat protein